MIAGGVVAAGAALVVGAVIGGGFTPADPRIDEGSGMVVSLSHADTVWIVNDSGDAARLFAVDTTDGHTRAVVTLSGATNVDWEALAISPDGGVPHLWVGDVGDNDAVRPSIQVYRLAEPDLVTGSTDAWTGYDFVYPDGPHDAETLLVDPRTDRLYVVTKGLLGGSVYEAPEVLRSDATNQLTRIGSAPLVVTDGAFRSDGSVVLRNYLNGFLRPSVTGPDQKFGLPRQRQGETLAVLPGDDTAYVGSEGAGTPVRLVTLPSLSSAPPSNSPTPGSGTETASGAPDATTGTGLGPWALAIGLAVVAVVLGLVGGVRRRRGQPRRSIT